ncbi:hypothetical protein LG634_06495 [Streptomyces bambusae]|uniref:hypothetical protein n=1 Tax=Streptomyces bambusae TaxID=1550616 RepID=UPI001CFE959B|nr:hypothetical protein [Streptomyces bambusae]MCB5164484.1 hypothetical protein [Streptomyces bambusae]
MIDALYEALDFLVTYKRSSRSARKQELQAEFIRAFGPRRVRSVLVGDGYALRFAEAQAGSFSNTILSLSALQQHDQAPFVVVVVRRDRLDFLLANSTMLKKVSHSSRDLRIGRVRGSFNGSDILREYGELPNIPANFGALFALHAAFTWDDNVERLVEATNAIVPRDVRFHPGTDDQALILAAPSRAAAALASQDFAAIGHDLVTAVKHHRQSILRLAALDNVNLRGNGIEQLITGDGSAHRLDDLERRYGSTLLSIDIKTKLLDRASAPKAYNVDKMLRFLAKPDTVAAVLVIGIDVGGQDVRAMLVPVLERSLLAATRIQHHWAGRGSRGVTQLSGPFGQVFESGYGPTVPLDQAREFLIELIAL